MVGAYLCNTRARELTVTPCVGSDIQWNFAKFLIGRDGLTVKRFLPSVLPGEIEPEVQAMI